jgi:vancomycin permeability regulator SanA
MIFLFRLFRRLLTFALLLVIVIPGYFAYSIWNEGHRAHPIKSDAIVVLGAAQFNGVPSDVLQARINRAGEVYHEGLAPRIITVGGNAKGDNFTEGSTSRRSLITSGIAKSVISSIPIGRDTLSSTIAYVNFLRAHKYRSIIIVTDPYHCYRAEAEAKDLGLRASCAPTLIGPASLKSAGWRYIARETGAYLAYKSVGQFGIHLTDQIKK